MYIFLLFYKVPYRFWFFGFPPLPLFNFVLFSSQFQTLDLETSQPVLAKFELATPQNIADFYEDIKCCSTNALASSPAFLVAFWIVKATMTTVTLYVSVTTVVELGVIELI